MRAITRATSEPSVRRPLLYGAAIALLILLTYSGSFGGAFISDDTQEVATKDLIRALDWNHVRAIFRSFDGPNYMPVTVLSFAVDYRLWGLTPAGYHFSNLLIHFLNALLVYALLRRLEMHPNAAFIAAVVWGVHPLQVESVAWISERKNVLSGLFFFAAFHTYLSFSERLRVGTYLGVLGLFLLAVLSKMNTMVLPAICLAYEIAFRFRLRLRDVLATVPMFAIAAAVAWYNLAGNPIHGGDYWGGSALVTWLSSSVVVFRYLGNLILPTDLTTYYEVRLRDSLFDPPVLFSLLGLAAMAVATVYGILTKRRWGFWILWFGIALAPMLNVVPFRSMMNDRFMYLPMLGPVALITVFLGESVHVRRLSIFSSGRPSRRRQKKAAPQGERLGCCVQKIISAHPEEVPSLGTVSKGVVPVYRQSLQRGRYPMAVVAAGVIAVYAGLSYRRVEIWANPLAYWKDWVLRLSYSGADPVFRQEDLDVKLDYLRRAVTQDPNSAVARNNLGAMYLENGRLGDAVFELEAAAKLNPNDPVIALNLGRAYAYARRLPEAKSALERAVVLDRYSFTAQWDLGRVSRAAGDPDTARRAYEACARIRPRDFNSMPYFRNEREYLKQLQAQPAASGSNLP